MNTIKEVCNRKYELTLKAMSSQCDYGDYINDGGKKMRHSSKNIVDYLSGNAQRFPSEGDSQL